MFTFFRRSRAIKAALFLTAMALAGMTSSGCATACLWNYAHTKTRTVSLDAHWSPNKCFIEKISPYDGRGGYLQIPYSIMESGTLPDFSTLVIRLGPDAMKRIADAQSLKKKVDVQIEVLFGREGFGRLYGDAIIVVDGQSVANSWARFSSDSPPSSTDLVPVFDGFINIHVSGNYREEYKSETPAWWFYPLAPFAAATDIATSPVQMVVGLGMLIEFRRSGGSII
jgi:hypothetical protein